MSPTNWENELRPPRELGVGKGTPVVPSLEGGAKEGLP